jgi:hypothetical protein
MKALDFERRELKVFFSFTSYCYASRLIYKRERERNEKWNKLFCKTYNIKILIITLTSTFFVRLLTYN